MIRKNRRASISLRLDVLEARTLLSLTGAEISALDKLTPTNSLLVRFLDGVPAERQAADLAALGVGASVVARFASGPAAVQVANVAGLAGVITRLQKNPDVAYAQPNGAIQLASTPNDPTYPSQWGLNQSNNVDINAPQAWDITTGTPTTLVADIDTGVDYTHRDLYLNVAINQGEIPPAMKARVVDTNGDGLVDFYDLNSLDASGKVVFGTDGKTPVNAGLATDRNGDGYIDAGDLLPDPAWVDGVDHDGDGQVGDLVGWNFVATTNNPMDDHGHGTHTSGTVAAVTNNATGVAGVDWNARILPLKFLDASGSGSDTNAIAAIEYAADHGARVINASWGGGDSNPALSDAITYAGSKGAVFVTAAGNAGTNNDTTPFYPASFQLPSELTVAAVDSSGALASFSNYGATTVDLAAPGVGIWSTLPGNSYGSWSGTSMATPHVTGVVALLAGLHPDWTAQQLVAAVKSSVKPLPSLTSKTITGGMVDAAAALASSGDVTLFSDNFSGSSVNPAWTFVGGTWTQHDGILSQTASVNDPVKAILNDRTYPAAVEISAMVRVESWTNGDMARAGVSLLTDPNTGQGYGLLFHNDTNTVQFLDDKVHWGNSYSFAWQVGTWYHFKLREQDGVLSGKIWADGTAEPSTWMFTQTGWTDRTAGAPALVGGSGKGTGNGTGNATTSFDNVTVSGRAAASTPAAPTNLAASAPSPSQVNLSWTGSAGTLSYKVERSPDGSTGWSQLAVVPAGTTTFSDITVTGNTAYFYRVLASNTVGDSPSSNVASITTPASTTLFSDDFSGSSVNPAWTFVGGTWTQHDGILSQTASVNDPVKAILNDRTYPAAVEISAMVRVESWTNGDMARAGVSLLTDPNTGQGYGLLFHNDTNTVQFLDDKVHWGNSYSFAWQVGTWYHFKLREQDGVLSGKIWADGTAEPSTWMFTQTGWTDRTAGAPRSSAAAAKAPAMAPATPPPPSTTSPSRASDPKPAPFPDRPLWLAFYGFHR